MAELLEREVRGDRAAVLAIEMFIRRTAAGIAAATTHLALVDAVVFTGGIGEHAPSVIDRIRDRLHLVGEPGAETTEDGDRITRSADGPATLCIAAREDLVIADAVVAIVGGAIDECRRSRPWMPAGLERDRRGNQAAWPRSTGVSALTLRPGESNNRSSP